MNKPDGTSKHTDGGPSELGRGATVGRYLVLELIGKGGMGEVYAAYDPELDRKIALKLLRPHNTVGVDPSEGRSRLLREAQAIARLSDPNVVVVFDVGTFGDRVFLAMEFVDGNTLAYWLHAQSRAWREVVATFTAAGRGLACAHAAGVVHRDFKPDNVMIGRDGKVRVMDFGLARTITPDAGEKPPSALPGTDPPRTRGMAIRGASASLAPRALTASLAPRTSVAPEVDAWSVDDVATRDLSRGAAGFRPESPTSALSAPLTETGAMMGTPAYMAPEQFQGGTVGPRTDQFSFCVALYEGLYGERAFEGKGIQALTKNVVAGRVRTAPADAKVPGWLRRVVLRGLRVDLADRHASMEALLAALARDPARARRRWVVSASIIGVIAVLAAGLVRAERRQRTKCLGADTMLAGIWELPSGKSLSPRKQAIRDAFLSTGKRYAADSFAVVAYALDRYVKAWNAMHREACEATNVRGEQSAEVLDLRMSCLQDRFSEVRALTAVFSDANGDVVSKAVGAAQALKPVEQCADIATLRAVVRPPDDPTVRRAVAEVRVQLANVKALANAGKYKSAEDRIGPVRDAARKTNYQPVIAEVLLQLAVIQTERGDVLMAEINYEQAVWIADACRHDEVVVQATAGLIYAVGYLQGRYADGVRWARHATAALARLGPGHDVVAGWRANNLAVMYERQGQFEDSLAAGLEAVTLKSRALGASHFDVGISQSNVALALFRLGRIDEAIVRNRQALEISRTALGPEHPQVAINLTNGAEFLNAKGQHLEARALANQAVTIWEREFGPDHPPIGYPLTTIGESLVDDGQPGLAIPYLERALGIRETGDPEAELLGETRFALARALWGSSRGSNRALSLAAQARSDFEKKPTSEKQRADVDRWIAERATRTERISMQ